ncbi:MAG: TetR/AcrR family transcriptional regulator [Spirochaetia bacterium]
MHSRFESQRNKILETAFTIWARSQFSKTSLSLVAGELKLSKAALYRYFANKEHLQTAMVEKYINDMGAALAAFIKDHGKEPATLLITSYYSYLFDYFLAKPHYYAFLHSYLMRTTPGHQERFLKLRNTIDDLFFSALQAAGHSPDREDLLLSIRYIHMTCFFWFMQLYMSVQPAGTHPHSIDFSQRIPEDKRSRYLNKSIEYGLSGLVAADDYPPVDCAAIEASVWVRPDEMPEPDRIFSAIEAEIAESGYVKASVEKIAARIGINKSSLYFYFKNKNDMLFKTIKREQEYFFKLVLPRLDAQPDFHNKLYAFIIAITSYTAHNPGMITVLNWARYQNIGMSLPKHELHKIFDKFEFLRRALDRGILRGTVEDFRPVFIFVFFFIMHKLRELPVKTTAKTTYLGYTRRIFSLFCGGIHAQLTSEKRSVSC